MEISGTVSTLLREKKRVTSSIAPSETVYSAIEMMAQHNIGALPVLESGETCSGWRSEAFDVADWCAFSRVARSTTQRLRLSV